ncbi:MAG: hypothetical protein ACM31L_01670 [Actinomycetota bacterium]
MNKSVLVAFAAVVALSGCDSLLPPPDQPAHPSRIGRFIGLVSRCGCSDISKTRMAAEWPKVVQGRYTPEQIQQMRGYVNAALDENFDNQIEICAEACSQKCMVESVAQPLEGRSTGVAACPITERDLHLTFGRFQSDTPASR